MDLVDMIKDSLRYPAENYMTWAVLAVICFIISICSLAEYSVNNSIVSAVMSIIVILVTFIQLGYCLKLIKSQINGPEITIKKMDELPETIKNEFIDGIKLTVVGIVYMIVPAVIFAIISFLTGAWGKISAFIGYFTKAGFDAVIANPEAIVNAIPNAVLMNFVTSAVFLTILGVILMIVFALLLEIATAKLAETGSITDAINFKVVVEKISSIGWGRYIVYAIIMAILGIICLIIQLIVSMIPAVGPIISDTIVVSFYMMFSAIALGKLCAY